jgi:hypothetical protein
MILTKDALSRSTCAPPEHRGSISKWRTTRRSVMREPTTVRTSAIAWTVTDPSTSSINSKVARLLGELEARELRQDAHRLVPYLAVGRDILNEPGVDLERQQSSQPVLEIDQGELGVQHSVAPNGHGVG